MNQLFNRLILIICCTVVTTASGVFFLWPVSAEAQGEGFAKPASENRNRPARKSLKLKWAQAPPRDVKKWKKKKKPVIPKTHVKARLTLIRLLSREKVEQIDLTRSKPSKSILVRSEPRRDRKIKLKRTIFRPWFRSLIDSLRIGGYVVDDYIKPLSGNESDEELNQVGVNLTVSAQAYIWRPWFATLGGGVGISVGRSDSNSSVSEYNTLIGNARLSIFPTSRFPFEAGYEKNRSQVDYNRYGSVVDTEQYRVSQSYKSKGGASYFATYEMSKIESETDTLNTDGQVNKPLKDKIETLNFGSSKSFVNHNLNLTGQYSSVDRYDTVESSESATVVGSHRYYPGGSLSIDNMINFYRDTNVSLPGGGSTGADQFTELVRDVFQVSSYSFWQPKGKQFSVNMGARYFASIFTRDAQDSGVSMEKTEFENTNANFNLGLNYDVDENLRLRSAANVSRTTSGDTEAISSDQSLGLVYSSDDIKVLTAIYNWQYSHTIFNSVGDNENLLSMQTQLGHSLGKSYKIGKISSLSIDLTQIYSVLHYIKASHESYNKRTDTPTEEGLTHGAALSWSSSSYWGRATVRLTGTDTRNRGVAFREEEQVFQIVTFTTIIEAVMSRYQRLMVDMNIQFTNDNSTDDYSYNSASRFRGSIAYRNGKFLGVRSLRFTSEVRISDESLLPSFGDEEEFESFSWENKLDLRVGKLEMTGIVRMAQVNRILRHIAMLRVMRSFGQ